MSNEVLTDLVDWENGLVSPKIFVDQEIFEEEMRRLFGRSWLFLAHDSQFERPGDFFSTFMGTDPVLVVKQEDGSFKALLNACRHRGMKVCRADAGNLRAFACTYHGWTYDTSGKLINVPNLEECYYGELELDKWGLVEVAQVDSYKGLIFGNFDPTAPSLREYLGEMTWYLDSIIDRREGGTIVVPSVHKITYKGNWKIAAEQFAGDNYHFGITHASALMAREQPQPVRDMASGRQFASRLGHGMAGFLTPEGERARAGYQRRTRSSNTTNGELVADYDDQVRPEIDQRLGVRSRMASASTIFPNCSFLSTVINVWQPKTPNSFEEWRWLILDKAAPPEVRYEQARATRLALIDADDGENWSEMGRNMNGPQVQRLMLNYQMGLGHENDADPTYPGRIGYRWCQEGAQRAFYRRWLEFMQSDAWPHLDADELAQVTPEHVRAGRG